MAGKTNLTATLFAQKKLLGKTSTGVHRADNQEPIPSGLQVAAQSIFSQDIPGSPSKTLWEVQGPAGKADTVEYVEFVLTQITGSTYDANDYDSDAAAQSSGPHAYRMEMTGNYQSLTDNSKAGNGVFDNSKILHWTLGGLQLISPGFSNDAPNPYTLSLYSGSRDVDDEIPLLDELDWQVDYYSGVVFIQDYNSSKIPTRAKGFIYVGDMLSASLGSSGGGTGTGVGWYGSGNGTISTTGSLLVGTNTATPGNAEISFTSVGAAVFNEQGRNSDFRVESQNRAHAVFVDASTDQILLLSGGAAGSPNESSYTDVAFFVSGTSASRGTAVKGTALFGGDVHISGNLTVGGVSPGGGGSGTGVGWLGPSAGIISTTGSVYIGVTGGSSNPDITFGNTGAATFNEQAQNSDFRVESQANTHMLFVDASASTVGIGTSTPKKALSVVGAVSASLGFSGSLTRLIDGSSYLVAGSNVTITSASNGAVTIASSGGGTPAGSNTQIQYNNDGSFGGSSAFTFTGTEVQLDASSPKYTIKRSNQTEDSAVSFEGSSGVSGATISHEGGSNDLVFKTFGNGGASLEEILRLGGYYSGDNRKIILLSGSNIHAGGMQPHESTDIAFFVSGAIDSRGTGTPGAAVFGGDVVVSGTVSINRAQAGVGSFVTITSDGKVGIGSDTPAYKLSVGGNMDVGEYIYHKNDADTFIRFQEDQLHIKAGGESMIKMKEDSSNQVLILSGGSGNSIDPDGFTDTNFFVSGSIGSRGTSVAGSSVFGGDVVISGTLYGGSPLKIDGGMEVTGTMELKPKLGGVAIVRNPHGPVKLFASSALKLGSNVGTIDLLDLGDGAAGALHLTGTGLGINRSVSLNTPGTLFFTGAAGGSYFKGKITAHNGLSGSLTRLTDGTSYLIAGTNITLTSASNGSVTIAASSGGGASSVGWIGRNSGLIDTTGSLGVSGSLDVASQIRHIGDTSTNIAFRTGQVLVMSGGAASSSDESLGADVSVYVSGSVGSITTTTRGTTLFGGDARISGSLGVSLGMTVGGHILPSEDASYNLGSLNKRFANIYTGDLHLRNDRGNWTIIEESDYLCVVNNMTGCKYKMVLEAI